MHLNQEGSSKRNYLGPSIARMRSAFPDDATAVIEREPRSVTQSAPVLRRGWRLRFKPSARPTIKPLMGWTSGSDPMAHVTLRFPDLASAIRYAERHDLPYEVLEEPRTAAFRSTSALGSGENEKESAAD